MVRSKNGIDLSCCSSQKGISNYSCHYPAQQFKFLVCCYGEEFTQGSSTLLSTKQVTKPQSEGPKEIVTPLLIPYVWFSKVVSGKLLVVVTIRDLKYLKQTPKLPDVRGNGITAIVTEEQDPEPMPEGLDGSNFGKVHVDSLMVPNPRAMVEGIHRKRYQKELSRIKNPKRGRHPRRETLSESKREQALQLDQNLGKSSKKEKTRSGASGSDQHPTKDDEQSSDETEPCVDDLLPNNISSSSTGIKITNIRDVVDDRASLDSGGHRYPNHPKEWTFPPNGFPGTHEQPGQYNATKYNVLREQCCNGKSSMILGSSSIGSVDEQGKKEALQSLI
ncbi:hypothetical protein Tco_0603012 [Tanacetum coccineum]